MKKVFSLVLVLTLVSTAITVFAKTMTDYHDFIVTFYKAYATAFSEKDMLKSFEKCDSVMAIYCTETLCKDTKDDRKETGICYDYATDDEGADELSYKTIKVTKRDSYYIVTYLVNNMNDRNQKYVKSVKLKVTMSNGKIATVKSLTKD